MNISEIPIGPWVGIFIFGVIVQQGLGAYAIRTSKTPEERRLQAKLAERSITTGPLRSLAAAIAAIVGKGKSGNR